MRKTVLFMAVLLFSTIAFCQSTIRGRVVDNESRPIPFATVKVNNSVDPSVKITLRGYRSLTGNNDALVVIDGLQQAPGSSTMLNLLNPNDIESISILKGGQAATLYGSDGVNGAIVITTKKGT